MDARQTHCGAGRFLPLSVFLRTEDGRIWKARMASRTPWTDTPTARSRPRRRRSWRRRPSGAAADARGETAEQAALAQMGRAAHL